MTGEVGVSTFQGINETECDLLGCLGCVVGDGCVDIRVCLQTRNYRFGFHYFAPGLERLLIRARRSEK